MKILKSVAVLMVLLCGVGASATTPQEALEDASHYTVQIFRSGKIGLNADEGGSGSATGFVIDRNRGWILTNAHVASRSPAKLQVEFKEGGTIKAKRVYVDHYLDIAVIAVDPADLPKAAINAQLDCANLPKVGTPVAIFGNPADFRFVASRGIVSGIPWLSQREHIQSDAAINSGNSGGPLIDLETGKVIGVAAESYKYSSDNATVVALSVPMPSVCTVLDLLRSGRDPNLRMLNAAIGTRPRDGRPIVAFDGDGDSKLLPGDLIVAVDKGRPLRNPADLYDHLRWKSGAVELTVERSGEKIQINTLVQPLSPLLGSRSLDLSGLVISEPWRLDYSFSGDRGYLVVDFIMPDTPAENLELQLSSIVLSVDGRAFSKLDDLHAYLSTRPAGSEVELVIRKQSDEFRFHGDYSIVRLSVDGLKWIEADM